MKIAIIGYSGSGKSTLAKQMGERLNIPYYHLDKIQFTTNWQNRDREEAYQLVHEIMIQEQWIIDGNYSSFDFQRRMEDADQIIFMNYPRRVCLYRALKRNVEYRGKSRDSIAEGCNEKFDFEFLWWILAEGRSKKFKERVRLLKQKYPQKYVEIKNNQQLKQFIQQV